MTVRDSKSGEDITAKVLAQLILEHDPPKLAAFPAELLHQIIRSNESLLREFVEKYFSRALAAFLRSQQEFDRYLGQALGLYSMNPLSRGWAEMMMGPFARAFLAPVQEQESTEQTSSPHPSAEDPKVWKMIEELKQQVADLRKQLDQHPE